MTISAGRDWLTGLAWLNIALHVVGLGFAALGMRPGTPAVSLDQRLEYLAAAPLGWTLGWATWMCCAVSLIAFLAVSANRLTSQLARLGRTIAVVGAGFDLFCDSAYIVVFPQLASGRSAELFLTVERLTAIGSLVIANGAYSVGILLIALDMHRQGRARPITTGVGLGVAGFGLIMAAAGFTGVAWHVEYATGPTMLLFCIWVVLVARDLERAA